MPELPEVEACRRLAELHCIGKRIQEAQVADDDKVIEGIDPSALQQALVGRTIKVAHRMGKHMWLKFDKEPCLMLHFGMTGSLVVKGVKSHQYKNFKVDEAEWPPKYWKLVLKLEGDVSVAFADSRRFARIRLQDQPAKHAPVSLLGFDPVLSMPSLEEFANMTKAKKTSLKALLLDQAFSAGVGNWVADEVLYQAKLYPEVKASSLTDEEIERLHQSLKYVPETAVAAEAESEKFPQDWLFHVRWDGPKKSPKLNGNAVEFLKVGGRTTAYVPAVQKPGRDDKSSKQKKQSKKRKAAADSEASEGEDDQSAEETEEQPLAATKGKGSKAATAASKRRKAAADKSAEAVTGTNEGTGESPKVASRGARRSKQPVEAAADSKAEEEQQPKKAFRAKRMPKQAVAKASDSEEEEDQQPKKTVRTGKKPKQTYAEASGGEEEEQQQQPRKAAKRAHRPNAAVTKRKAEAKATEAEEEGQ